MVSRYLATKTPSCQPKGVIDKLHTLLKEHKSRPVDVKGLRALEAAEKAHKGPTECIGEFKYVTNQEMLTLVDRGMG